MLQRTLLRSYRTTSRLNTPLLNSYLSVPKLSPAGQSFEAELMAKSKLQSVANNRHELFLKSVQQRAAEMQMIAEDPSLSSAFEKSKALKAEVASKTSSLLTQYAQAEASKDLPLLSSLSSSLQSLERELQLNPSPLESLTSPLKLTPASQKYIETEVSTRYSSSTKRSIIETLSSSKPSLISLITGKITPEKFMEEVGEKGSIAGSLLEELMVGGEVMKKEEAESRIDSLIIEAATEYTTPPGAVTSPSDIGTYNAFINSDGDAGRLTLKKLTGCTFGDEVKVSDSSALLKFVTDLESDPSVITSPVSSYFKNPDTTPWTHIFSPCATLVYCCKLVVLSSLPCPKFLKSFTLLLPQIAQHGNMRQLSQACELASTLNLDSPEFWDIVTKNSKNIVHSCTSSEASIIAKSLSDNDIECEEYFKTLVTYFDHTRENEMKEYTEDYLRPSTYTSKSGRRIHYTTSEDMARFTESFAHFKYDSPALFEKCFEYSEVYKSEKLRIGKAMKVLGYQIEGTGYA
ncbi:hypothetical protein TrST_g2179 [Triparma strigata]|uniref:Uncharacterized protein n=1 Tax=Triparma strigata TaxID=1606541 RepID=A0A9W7EYR7_9STRA|nr:hypothetical protein TrST_g2179 [Triparma strigata]